MLQLNPVGEASFWWAVGIEDTFVTAPYPRTGRTFDAYALSGHDTRWASDIDLIADLGVPIARYGLPWPLINPSRGQWDWAWSDRAVDRLLERGVTPIVDLVHYGTPLWMDDSFLNPDYPRWVADYAARAAERYRGRIHLWTPLNEPRMTAWHCGRTGMWPPYGRSWPSFVAVLLALVRGIAATVKVLTEIDDANTCVHVDAANRWLSPDPPDDAELAALTGFRAELAFLALDLLSGRVDEQHPLWPWLTAHGGDPADLESFRRDRIELDLVGVNAYPMLSQKQFVRTRAGRPRIRFPYGTAQTIETIAADYWRRYRCPLLIGETAARGRLSRRSAWLTESVAGVRRARAAGIPLIGYTWWPLFDLVSWTYRQGRRPLEDYLVPMGLWNLDPETLDRIPTPLVDTYRDLVAGGIDAVGPLAPVGDAPR
jgi:beta-glucosidase/6-phospho-beta-glucosidase/beta-galactosidase